MNYVPTQLGWSTPCRGKYSSLIFSNSYSCRGALRRGGSQWPSWKGVEPARPGEDVDARLLGCCPHCV